MAQKEESTPGGLLSRVVRFVKNPATSWSDSEGGADRESSYSKQMLKEMIERKRRNDFVRKREFDMLRKMRRSDVLAGQDPAARPSFFQSSMPSKPDDRATTLKKIDEIEAQMSMQWWKTKHGTGPGPGTGTGTGNSGFAVSSHMPSDAPRDPNGPAPPARVYARTTPMPLPAAPAPARAEEAPLLEAMPPDLGGRNVVPRQHQPAPPAARANTTITPIPVRRSAAPAPAAAAMKGEAAARAHSGPTSSIFSASKEGAIEIGEFAHDPELEEASIRFANGDDEGAEAGLLEVLGPHGSRIEHEETWLTLFDLYRATGQQDRYESRAIEFAGRFGRSAPQWFSLPEIVGRLNQAQAAPAASQAIADWTCPAVFGTQTVAAMNAGIAKASQPFRLNWSKVNSIVDSAVEPLTKAFTQWAAQTVQLRFIGAEALEKVLRDNTRSGDRSVNPAWWRLRMEVMRVLHRPDEFELVALDYCVTYEVSPPSWDSARCEYKPLQPDGTYAGGHTIVGDSVMSSLFTGYGDDALGGGMSSQLATVAKVELSGQILGDGKEAMEVLDAKLQEADVVVISCARLMRIDFTAAGTLLNWVNARQAEGRQVQFVEVHRLVAAFFNVIGISEHARVGVRDE